MAYRLPANYTFTDGIVHAVHGTQGYYSRNAAGVLYQQIISHNTTQNESLTLEPFNNHMLYEYPLIDLGTVEFLSDLFDTAKRHIRLPIDIMGHGALIQMVDAPIPLSFDAAYTTHTSIPYTSLSAGLIFSLNSTFADKCIKPLILNRIIDMVTFIKTKETSARTARSIRTSFATYADLKEHSFKFDLETDTGKNPIPITIDFFDSTYTHTPLILFSIHVYAIVYRGGVSRIQVALVMNKTLDRTELKVEDIAKRSIEMFTLNAVDAPVILPATDNAQSREFLYTFKVDDYADGSAMHEGPLSAQGYTEWNREITKNIKTIEENIKAYEQFRAGLPEPLKKTLTKATEDSKAAIDAANRITLFYSCHHALDTISSEKIPSFFKKVTDYIQTQITTSESFIATLHRLTADVDALLACTVGRTEEKNDDAIGTERAKHRETFTKLTDAIETSCTIDDWVRLAGGTRDTEMRIITGSVTTAIETLVEKYKANSPATLIDALNMWVITVPQPLALTATVSEMTARVAILTGLITKLDAIVETSGNKLLISYWYSDNTELHRTVAQMSYDMHPYQGNMRAIYAVHATVRESTTASIALLNAAITSPTLSGVGVPQAPAQPTPMLTAQPPASQPYTPPTAPTTIDNLLHTLNTWPTGDNKSPTFALEVAAWRIAQCRLIIPNTFSDWATHNPKAAASIQHALSETHTYVVRAYIAFDAERNSIANDVIGVHSTYSNLLISPYNTENQNVPAVIDNVQTISNILRELTRVHTEQQTRAQQIITLTSHITRCTELFTNFTAFDTPMHDVTHVAWTTNRMHEAYTLAEAQIEVLITAYTNQLKTIEDMLTKNKDDNIAAFYAGKAAYTEATAAYREHTKSEEVSLSIHVDRVRLGRTCLTMLSAYIPLYETMLLYCLLGMDTSSATDKETLSLEMPQQLHANGGAIKAEIQQSSQFIQQYSADIFVAFQSVYTTYLTTKNVYTIAKLTVHMNEHAVTTAKTMLDAAFAFGTALDGCIASMEMILSFVDTIPSPDDGRFFTIETLTSFRAERATLLIAAAAIQTIHANLNHIENATKAVYAIWDDFWETIPLTLTTLSGIINAYDTTAVISSNQLSTAATDQSGRITSYIALLTRRKKHGETILATEDAVYNSITTTHPKSAVQTIVTACETEIHTATQKQSALRAQQTAFSSILDQTIALFNVYKDLETSREKYGSAHDDTERTGILITIIGALEGTYIPMLTALLQIPDAEHIGRNILKSSSIDLVTPQALEQMNTLLLGYKKRIDEATMEKIPTQALLAQRAADIVSGCIRENTGHTSIFCDLLTTQLICSHPATSDSPHVSIPYTHPSASALVLLCQEHNVAAEMPNAFFDEVHHMDDDSVDHTKILGSAVHPSDTHSRDNSRVDMPDEEDHPTIDPLTLKCPNHQRTDPTKCGFFVMSDRYDFGLCDEPSSTCDKHPRAHTILSDTFEIVAPFYRWPYPSADRHTDHTCRIQTCGVDMTLKPTCSADDVAPLYTFDKNTFMVQNRPSTQPQIRIFGLVVDEKSHLSNGTPLVCSFPTTYGCAASPCFILPSPLYTPAVVGRLFSKKDGRLYCPVHIACMDVPSACVFCPASQTGTLPLILTDADVFAPVDSSLDDYHDIPTGWAVCPKHAGQGGREWFLYTSLLAQSISAWVKPSSFVEFSVRELYIYYKTLDGITNVAVTPNEQPQRMTTSKSYTLTPLPTECIPHSVLVSSPDKTITFYTHPYSLPIYARPSSTDEHIPQGLHILPLLYYTYMAHHDTLGPTFLFQQPTHVQTAPQLRSRKKAKPTCKHPCLASIFLKHNDNHCQYTDHHYDNPPVFMGAPFCTKHFPLILEQLVPFFLTQTPTTCMYMDISTKTTCTRHPNPNHICPAHWEKWQQRIVWYDPGHPPAQQTDRGKTRNEVVHGEITHKQEQLLRILQETLKHPFIALSEPLLSPSSKVTHKPRTPGAPRTVRKPGNKRREPDGDGLLIF